MLVGSTNQVFFKTSTLGVHECNLHRGEQKSQLLLGWTDRTAYIDKSQRPTCGCGKIAILQSDCSPIRDMATLLYRTLT